MYVRMRVGFPASTYVARFALPQLQHMVLALSASATPANSANTTGMYTPIYPSKDYIPAQRSMDAKEASSLLNKAAAKLNIDGSMFEHVEHPPARSAYNIFVSVYTHTHSHTLRGSYMCIDT